MTSLRPVPGNALVLSYSNIETDPRVRRQIDWLSQLGWTVDTLGLGPASSPQTRDHFAISQPKSWVSKRIPLAFAHLFLTNSRLFQRLLVSRIPDQLVSRLRRTEYDLVLFNEFEFAPWANWIRTNSHGNKRVRIHLDIHEYRQPRQRWSSLGGWISGRQYRWTRNAIGSTAFDSRTVVCEPIGDLYSEEFGFERPGLLRNIPPYVSQKASRVDPQNIRLLFHGMASFARGFTEILDAMRTLPNHFSMTFMLMPNEKVHSWLREQIANHPARDRLHIVPPAPMRQIAEWINEYDVELIFYRPSSQNLEFALPNKFFESIQGRLALVVAEGKTMAPIVREWGIGVVTEGYEGKDLLATLLALTPAKVQEMKEASNRAAEALNAEVEGKNFIRTALKD